MCLCQLMRQSWVFCHHWLCVSFSGFYSIINSVFSSCEYFPIIWLRVFFWWVYCHHWLCFKASSNNHIYNWTLTFEDLVTLAMYTRIFVRKTLMPKNPFLCSKSKYIACGIYSSNFLYQLIQQWLSHYNVIFIT